jgi:putative secretion ATPase (PEP-CTERM system associated)
MYTSFFGLDEKPFELLPNPKFLFLSKGHKKALSYLEYGIQERAGFTLLTGEVGSGKTTLLRNIIKNLGSKTTLSMVFNTRVESEQLLALINEDFGLEVDGKDKIVLLRNLNDFLVKENSSGRRPIVIIDEAQNLPPESLEEIRLLSNLEFDSFKLLQIILVGQPELKQILAQPRLRQLRQRISISCHLGPLSREETEAYIYHRLQIAGNREAVSFDDNVFDLIYQFSSGGPRLINVICDFLLLTAFVEEEKHIVESMVLEAIEELSIVPDQEQADTPEIVKEIASQDKDEQTCSLEARISEIENQLLILLERDEEKEKFASQNEILKYLINQHQVQYNIFEDGLKKMNFLLNKMKGIISEPKVPE